MAATIHFICTHCDHTIDLPERGRPFLRDAKGKVRYLSRADKVHSLCEQILGHPLTPAKVAAYLAKHTEFEEEFICLTCGQRTPKPQVKLEVRYCWFCLLPRMIKTKDLQGTTCSQCGVGIMKTRGRGRKRESE